MWHNRTLFHSSLRTYAKTFVREKHKKNSLKQIYSSSWSFKSNDSLLKYLSANVVHKDKSGLVVINKPYGLPLAPSEDSPVCLQSCLKDFAEVINVKKLQVVKTVPKFASGCALLAFTESAVNTLKNCRNRLRVEHMLHENYLAVTLGSPAGGNTTETFDVFMERISDRQGLLGKPQIEPVIADELVSKRKLKSSQELFRVSTHLKVISRGGNGNVSLVSLHPTNIRHNVHLVYLANKLSPVLGDQHFGYRVKNIMGHPSKVSYTHSPCAPSPQKLPPSLLEGLGLHPDDADVVPLHFHLARVHLPRFYGKGGDLTVYAPPPEYFLATLEALNLRFDLEEFKLADEVVRWEWAQPKQKTKKQKIEIIVPDEIIPERPDLLLKG